MSYCLEVSLRYERSYDFKMSLIKKCDKNILCKHLHSAFLHESDVGILIGLIDHCDGASWKNILYFDIKRLLIHWLWQSFIVNLMLWYYTSYKIFHILCHWLKENHQCCPFILPYLMVRVYRLSSLNSYVLHWLENLIRLCVMGELRRILVLQLRNPYHFGMCLRENLRRVTL